MSNNTVIKSQIDVLIWRLQNSGDKLVRWRAAATLGGLGEEAEKVVSALATALLEDEYPRVREVAAEAIGRVGEKARAAMPALIRAMIEDEFDAVRLSAASSLKRIGEVAVLALFEAIRQNGCSDFREEAMKTLNKIGKWLTDAVPELTRVIVSELLKSMGEKNIELVRQNAKAALIRIGERAIPTLLEKMKNGKGENSYFAELTLEKISGNLGYENLEEMIHVYEKKRLE